MEAQITITNIVTIMQKLYILSIYYRSLLQYQDYSWTQGWLLGFGVLGFRNVLGLLWVGMPVHPKTRIEAYI